MKRPYRLGQRAPAPPATKSDPLRGQFYRRLACIVAGILPIVVLADEKGPLRFVALAGFLFAAWHFITLIALSPMIADAFFPPKVDFEVRERDSDRYFKYIATGYFFAAIGMLLFQLRRLDNTVGGTRLFWIAGGAGILVALLLTLLLRRLSATLYQEGARRFSVHAGIFLGSFLLLPSLASLYNEGDGAAAPSCAPYPLLEKSTSSGRSRAHYLTVDFGQGAERLEVDRDVFEGATEGAPLLICTRPGKLGFPVVDEVRGLSE